MANNDSGLFSCRNTCWIVGGLLGLVVFFLINAPWFWAFVVGGIVAVAVALILLRLFCSDVPAASGVTSAPAPAPAPQAPAAAAESAAEVTETPAAETPAEEKAPAKAKPAAAKPAAAAAGAPEGAPASLALLEAPREGGADDLKLIKGVGPGLEAKLQSLGVYHFDQIAGWSAADIDFVDDHLKFRGRIVRDAWVAQAKVLAEGGETEFSERASSTGLYEKNKKK